MATALITGANGFIGGHLAEYLVARGNTVRCLVRRPHECHHLKQLGVELVGGDVTQPATLFAAIHRVDVVYHLAALTSAFQPADMVDVNEGGTEKVSRICAAQSQPPILVVVSSVAAAGPTQKGCVRTESDPESPISHYGRTKRAGELAAAGFADRVPTTVVRPGIVFGKRNRELLPMFKAIERLRIHPSPGLSSPPLSIIYVQDLVEVLVAAAEGGRRLAGRRSERELRDELPGQGYYFACVNEFPTYSDLGRIVAGALGHAGTIVLPLAGPLPWVAAAVNETISRLRGASDSFNLDKIREAQAESWACSPAAIERDFGFKPRQTLDQQFKITADWYREHDWLGDRPVVAALRQAIRGLQPLAAISPTFERHHPAGSSNR